MAELPFPGVDESPEQAQTDAKVDGDAEVVDAELVWEEDVARR